MLGIILIIFFGVMTLRLPKRIARYNNNDLPVRITDKLDQLWGIAQDSMKHNKMLNAEKALLTILRVDNKSASAYNRLGILYAKQKSFKDAIECFEIAQSLEPSASSLHNVGLIYFENEDYDKAALAFEQALSIDSEVPSRHIAYAKVQEKLGHNEKMVEALEHAVRIDPVPQTLKLLADAYERIGRSDSAAKMLEKAEKLIATKEPVRRVVQPRRVVM